MLKRWLILVAIDTVVFLVLAEVLALAFYYAKHGNLFYVAENPVPAPLVETERGELSADVLHPYFGPIHRPGIRVQTNNIGFGSPYSFPYTRTSERQFLLGIFGGSVARYFCDRGMPRLVSVLQQTQAFVDREIVPLCFSHEGYKQPQQLIVLAYFLSLGQQFDLVVNIDGFNEVALGSRNNERGRDISMPSPIHMDPLLNLIDRATMTPAKVYSLARISEYKETLNKVARTMRRTRIAAVYFALDRYYVFTMNRYQSELATFDRLRSNAPSTSVLLLTPPVRPRGEEDVLYDDLAREWAEASRSMGDLLRARGMPYLHVLQPNQYFSQHVFAPDEARVALNPNQPFKPPVQQGYPALRRASATLAAKEDFIDATNAFDHEAGAMYEDDCCHYTMKGNEVLADLIAQRVRALALTTR